MNNAPKYKATITRSNRNNSHTLALDFIQSVKASGLKVLEVGCSTGYFGAKLRQLGHHVTGVELDSNSAALAQPVLDEVHCTSIEKFYAEYPDRKFDIICFGDVLEHLYDPRDVLERSAKQLVQGGHIVCSVPNIGHACIRGTLLEGEWNYSDLGTLDRTHIRFFTKKTLIELFQSASLEIEKLQSVRLTTQQVGEMCSIQLKAETLAKLREIKNDATKDDFQYVVSAKKASGDMPTQPTSLANRNPLKILALCDSPSSTITKIRVELPLTEFADAACRELRIQAFVETKIRDLAWADIVVVQRGMSKQSARLIKKSKDFGKPVIYEIDDLLTEFPDFLSHHKSAIENKALIERNIRNSTLITVTNAKLKAALEHLSSNISVCPNYANPLDTNKKPDQMHTGVGPVNLFVGSSDQIKVDFIVPALRAIQEKYKGDVAIHCIGPISKKIAEGGVICTETPILNHSEFIPFLKKHANAVGIIPLDESKFSSCKSAVKYFDYSQAGLAVACSNVSPYLDIVENGRTGLLSLNTTDSWVNTLSQLIDSRELRESITTAAQREISTKHCLTQTVEAWKKVFERLAPNEQIKTQPVPALRIKARLHVLQDSIRELNQQRKLKRAINKASRT